MSHKKKRILVGLSGGVDSAVSAYLLREEGHEVACWFMINYLDETDMKNCTTLQDLEEAKKVAAHLWLPLYTFDYRDEYEERIISYIYREYSMGRTPNPDVFCNNLVKFDLFLEEALHLGYDGIATGHYARLEGSHLYKGVDPEKDQSYFLSRTTPHQREHARFPIGHLPKAIVREIARATGLPNAERKDSQWLCFIGKIPMRDFLDQRIPKKPGPIIDQTGQVIGEHEWAHRYTIGQRRGIMIGGGPARYVLSIDIASNTIRVWEADESELSSNTAIIADWVWENPGTNKLTAKIRYRQADQEIEAITQHQNEIHLHFSSPQRAITPGQIAVIYQDDRVIGSGIIIWSSHSPSSRSGSTPS